MDYKSLYNLIFSEINSYIKQEGTLLSPEDEEALSDRLAKKIVECNPIPMSGPHSLNEFETGVHS